MRRIRANLKLKSALVLLGFGVPFILIYKAFFLPGPLAWGDAPFFAPENLKELFNLPYLWNFRHDNFGTPQYYILWLYLPTYLYGVLNNLFGIGNDLLIRIIFYFPATILAIVGSWKLIGKFNQNIWGQFLGSCLYGFNTYFLMLVDGGQVGVVLAYGLFPITVLGILSYLSNFSIRNYLFALAVSFMLMSSDIRIAVVGIVFTGIIGGIWEIGKIKKVFRRALILGISLLGLCAYWVIPTLSSLGNLGVLGNLGGVSSGTNFIHLSNSLFLFQPHFPLNQFGKTVSTPFYFTLLLPLIFGSLILISKLDISIKRGNILRLSLLFLIFAFLAKGGSEPLGVFYSWFVGLPGGLAFRDSSKFYIPLILVGGVLLSFTVSSLEGLVKQRFVGRMALASIYIYLLILIYPAILGNLSGVLGGVGEARGDEDYQKINQVLSNDTNFSRSLWFEEKPAQFYGSWSKPAISANNLYKDRPFASMIVGKYDFFNYVHSPQFCEWLNLLGMRYVLLPEPERKKITDEKEQKYRQELLTTIAGNSCLSLLNIGTSFPVYKTDRSMPQAFAQKKAVLVIGGEDIYNKLIKLPGFSLSNQGFIFAEDGRTDLNKLSKLDPQSLVILFANKDSIDLQMGYFVNQMISASKALDQQWKVYGSGDYLTWKYELLKNDIDTREFDFGKGVAISTILGERMKFKLPVDSPGNYYLAVRFDNSVGGGIKVKFSGNEYRLQNKNMPNFKWQLIGPISLNGNEVEAEVTNEGSFALFNTLALIPEEQLKIIKEKSQTLTNRYRAVFINNDEDWGRLGELGILGDKPVQVNYQQTNPTEYKLTDLPNYPVWITFSDHYDPNWGLNSEVAAEHFPFYASFNGFYLNGQSSNIILSYLPQKQVKISAIVSLLSVLVIVSVSTVIWIRRRKQKSEV